MRYLAALLALVSLLAAGDEPDLSAFRLKRDKRVKRHPKLNVDEVKQALPTPPGKRDPRDGIPAIDQPMAVAAAAVTWLRDSDRVLGVVVNGKARAYSLLTLERHEMVNDTLGGVPIAPNY